VWRPAVLPLALVLGSTAAAPRNVDVSNARGPQSEVSIAVDPTNPRVLVAGSNSYGEATTRAYGSTDRGATWSSTPAPPRPSAPGVPGAVDPSVAIDGHGRQYFSFVATAGRGAKLAETAYVSRRAGPTSGWGPPVRVASFADRPVLAVDVFPGSPHPNRLYLAWTRFTNGPGRILVSRSDGGLRWSSPVSANGRSGGGVAATIAAGSGGDVYVGWDARGRLLLTRSRDGGEHFARAILAATVLTVEANAPCGFSSGRLPAQPLRCLTPNPVVSVDASSGRFAGRVYVTYASFRDHSMDVLVTAFDRSLRRVLAPRIVTPGRQALVSDQFMPVSAVDSSTGTVWVCFYDTAGDRRRIRATFSCTASASGGARWSRPRRVASVSSNVAVPAADQNGYGDYAGFAVARGVAHPAWTDTRRLATHAEEIYTAVVKRP
jgi:hypothetical protein